MTFKHFAIPIALASALATSATVESAQHDGGRFRASHPGELREHQRFERGASGRFVDRRFDHPFVGVRVVRPFGGPYFAFRPRFHVGSGLYVGWPVPYPWSYVEVYPDFYPYPPYVGEADAQHNYGGLSFSVTPSDATVVVDGIQVGQVQAFSPSTAPLTLEPGQHHVTIEEPGYHTMVFDVDVVAGQVTPYQGTMQHM